MTVLRADGAIVSGGTTEHQSREQDSSETGGLERSGKFGPNDLLSAHLGSSPIENRYREFMEYSHKLGEREDWRGLRDRMGDRGEALRGHKAPAGLYEALVRVAGALGYTVRVAEVGGASYTSAYTQHSERLIFLYPLAPGALVSCLAHELVHAYQWWSGRPDDDEVRRRLGILEAEAEMVAYLLCASRGLNTQGYSALYVVGWCFGHTEWVSSSAAWVLGTYAWLNDALGAAGGGQVRGGHIEQITSRGWSF